jgi:AcrR family transcriptional regulator
LEEGYKGTSIDDMTEEAGLMKAALYWHFQKQGGSLKNGYQGV